MMAYRSMSFEMSEYKNSMQIMSNWTEFYKVKSMNQYTSITESMEFVLF